MAINWTTVFCSAAIIGAVAAILPKAIKKCRQRKDSQDGLELTPDEDDSNGVALYQKFIDECCTSAERLLQKKPDVKKAVLSLEKGELGMVQAVLYIKNCDEKLTKTKISSSCKLNIKDCPQAVTDAINTDGFIVKNF